MKKSIIITALLAVLAIVTNAQSFTLSSWPVNTGNTNMGRFDRYSEDEIWTLDSISVTESNGKYLVSWSFIGTNRYGTFNYSFSDEFHRGESKSGRKSEFVLETEYENSNGIGYNKLCLFLDDNGNICDIIVISTKGINSYSFGLFLPYKSRIQFIK